MKRILVTYGVLLAMATTLIGCGINTDGAAIKTNAVSQSTQAASSGGKSTSTTGSASTTTSAATILLEPALTMEEAWGDSVSKHEIKDFSDSYLVTRNVIDENDKLLVMTNSGEKSFGLLNVKTNEYEEIIAPEEGFSYLFSSIKDNCYILSKIKNRVEGLPDTVGMLIYNTDTKEIRTIDLSELQKASGNRYIYYAGRIYDGKMYFGATDVVPAPLNPGQDFDYSIYSYDLQTASADLIQNFGSSPTVSERGMYFKNIGTDGETASLYFKDAATSEVIELIKDCGEYQIAGDQILFTRGQPDKEIYIYENGIEELQYKETDRIRGWNYETNGRLITFDTNSTPVHVYDSKLKRLVLVSDAAGAVSPVANDRYLVWIEVKNPDRAKGTNPQQAVYYLDISGLGN